MTDQTIPDKVREIAAAMRAAMRRDERTYPEARFLADMSGYIRDLESLSPAPPRPTMADMTPAERRGCQWMQCEVRGERRIITLVSDDDDHNDAVTLAPSGSFFLCSLEIVTPLPDLPRLTWPGTEKVENANTVKAGDVIQSADDPRLDALPVGTVLVDCDGETVAKRSDAWAGLGYIPIESEGDEFGPWRVRRIGWEADQ